MKEWWPYGNDVRLFLNEYCRVAKIYMEFASKYKILAFIEGEDLREKKKVEMIMRHINISKIDSQLIDLTIHSKRSEKIKEFEKETILNSEAFKIYMEMKEYSQAFYSQNL